MNFLTDRDELQKGDFDACFRPYGVGSGAGLWHYVGWRVLGAVGGGLWAGALLIYLTITLFTWDIRPFW